MESLMEVKEEGKEFFSLRWVKCLWFLNIIIYWTVHIAKLWVEVYKIVQNYVLSTSNLVFFGFFSFERFILEEYRKKLLICLCSIFEKYLFLWIIVILTFWNSNLKYNSNGS